MAGWACNSYVVRHAAGGLWPAWIKQQDVSQHIHYVPLSVSNSRVDSRCNFPGLTCTHSCLCDSCLQALRPESIILMGKNTMMKRSIRLYCEETGNDQWAPLLDQLVGNVGLIFTKADLSQVRTWHDWTSRVAVLHEAGVAHRMREGCEQCSSCSDDGAGHGVCSSRTVAVGVAEAQLCPKLCWLLCIKVLESAVVERVLCNQRREQQGTLACFDSGYFGSSSKNNPRGVPAPLACQLYVCEIMCTLPL